METQRKDVKNLLYSRRLLMMDDVYLLHTPGVRDDVREGATLKVLHHHPQLVTHQETVVHVHDVQMMVVAHYYHL